MVCQSPSVDAIIEATGTIEYGARVVLDALQHRKHVVLCNAELDATLGPILKAYADQAGVVYSNVDGDEPGVAMNLIRFVRGIGLRPVVAGNLKGLYDPYRTPDTQREFAKRYGQNPRAAASFADGTKLSMELAVLANATGFQVARPGMYGPKLSHVDDTAKFYRDKLLRHGMVDFTVGAAPANGAFVLGHTDAPVQQAYLKYMKMGDGPLYTFYTPFHLPQWEAATTVARAVLLGDATIAPQGAPVCDAVSVAKRDLSVGETLDGLGGFTCYGRLENYPESRRQRALPIGLSEGCRLLKGIAKDQTVSYDDVVLPEDRLSDQLRLEQDERFFSATVSAAQLTLTCS
jgi:predicted homoserine dehydrogenase-like protein